MILAGCKKGGKSFSPSKRPESRTGNSKERKRRKSGSMTSREGTGEIVKLHSSGRKKKQADEKNSPFHFH